MTELVRKALFSENGAEGAALTPSQEDRERLNLTGDALSHVDNLLPREARQKDLPPFDENYPEAVREAVEEASASRFYVVPPFGRLREQADEVHDSLGKKYARSGDLAIVTLLSVLEGLSDEDVAALTLPVSFFHGQRARHERARSLHLGHPKLILEPREYSIARRGQLQVRTVFYAGTPVEEEPPVTKFFSVPTSEDTDEEDVLDDFERLLRQGGGETAYGFVHRGQMDPDDTWSYEYLSPERQREIDEIKELGDVHPLGELFGVKVGRHLLKDLQEIKESPGEGNIPWLEARDIRPDGTLAYEDTRVSVKQEELEGGRHVWLQEDDICVRQIGGMRSGGGGIVAGRVGPHGAPAIASHNVLVLRPREETTEEDADLALQYLRSEAAYRHLSAQYAGETAIHITVGELRNLPVPVADEDLRGALRSLTEAAEQFERWKQEALDAASSLFDHPTAEDGKMHVLTTGRRTRQRLRAAERQDDLSHRIQTQFPYPIAYRWRTVAASRADLEGYLCVLECAEVLCCYLATIAIATSMATGKEIGYLDHMGGRIAKGHGTNLGDWVAILREVRDSKSFRKLPDSTPFYEVTRFIPDGEEADKALSSLKERRDDQAHGRGPESDAVPSAFESAKEELLELLGAAEFLSEYPLRYVERTKPDVIENCLTYKYREVMGDHPLVPVHEETIDQTTLESESLYVVDRSGSLHLLRPLLDRRRCPVCGTWSTFYLDSYLDDESACRLKSMEHGHTTRDREATEAFRKTGLLPNDG
ncbi:hypothetical protein GGP50_001743 [Salinibacter ruber]|uniref:hypothetical protein n=1 Tax=Salinibacter ruber TaxID=146919 RepID=UPI00216A8389|nr:hypothetical protein [Salinibacter ruber]MCS4193522.1 hypothetical protein [Salinibacter ruber]